MTAWVVRIVLIVLLAVACVTDTRARRIPNWVCLAGFVVAFAWHGLAAPGGGLFDPRSAGGLGWVSSLLGALAAFGVFLLFYLARMMGAGDVKMMGMLGAVFGLDAVLELVLAVCVAGGVLSVVRMLFRRNSARVLANLRLLLMGAVSRSVSGVGPQFDAASDSADRLPYAYALSLGAIVLAIRCQLT